MAARRRASSPSNSEVMQRYKGSLSRAPTAAAHAGSINGHMGVAAWKARWHVAHSERSADAMMMNTFHDNRLVAEQLHRGALTHDAGEPMNKATTEMILKRFD